MFGLIYLVSSLAGAALAQTTALNTSETSLTSSQYSGSGCPKGSVSTSFSADRRTITLAFDSINLYLGPGTTRLDAIKNCAVQLRLQYPPGWRFIIEDVTWHGFFTLPSDVRASLYSSFEVSSVDLQVVSVPTLLINGTDTERGRVVTERTAVGNELASWCTGAGSENRNVTDGIVAHDRWALTGLRTGATVEDWMGGEGERTALVQQIGLRWVGCR